jgi:hypothetical protein
MRSGTRDGYVRIWVLNEGLTAVYRCVLGGDAFSLESETTMVEKQSASLFRMDGCSVRYVLAARTQLLATCAPNYNTLHRRQQ